MNVIRSFLRVLLSPLRLLVRLLPGRRAAARKSSRVFTPKLLEAGRERPASARQARALRLFEESFATLSTRLGIEFQGKLDEELQRLRGSFTADLEALHSTMRQLRRATVGRIDLLHDEMEEIRNSLATRMGLVEKESRAAQRSLAEVQSVTREMDRQWRCRAIQFEEEIETTRASIESLGQSSETRFSELSERQGHEFDYLHYELERQAGAQRKVRSALSGQSRAITHQLRRVRTRLGDYILESERLLGMRHLRRDGSFIVRLCGRLLSPFRWIRTQGVAIRKSLELQRSIVLELAEVQKALTALSRDVAPPSPLGATRSEKERFDPRILEEIPPAGGNGSGGNGSRGNGSGRSALAAVGDTHMN